MRKILICVLLLFALTVSAFAAQEYISDGEELFSGTQKQQLSQMLSDLSDQHGIAIVIVTADSFANRTPVDYAQSCWTYGQFGEDGILLLFSMTLRQYCIYTAGEGRSIFNDTALDRIEEAVVSALHEDDPYGAANAFAQTIQSVFESKASWAWKTPLICFGVGAVIGLIVVFVMVGKHKNVYKKAQACDYICPGSFRLTQSLDLYLYQTTTRRPRPQNTGGGGGSSGRSSGHRSGSF